MERTATERTATKKLLHLTIIALVASGLIWTVQAAGQTTATERMQTTQVVRPTFEQAAAVGPPASAPRLMVPNGPSVHALSSASPATTAAQPTSSASGQVLAANVETDDTAATKTLSSPPSRSRGAADEPKRGKKRRPTTTKKNRGGV